MNNQLLPSKRYVPPPLARRDTHITVIDDEVQEGLQYFPSELWHSTLGSVLSPTDDDFPTPKADDFPKPGASVSTIKQRQKPADFDEMYDATDDESEEVPLICSNSVKKMSRGSNSRYPSIIIPSPEPWPMIPKLQQSASSTIPPTPPGKIPVSPAKVCFLSTRSLQVPTRSSTPSLDGDFSSADDLTDSSCPSTPDTQHRNGHDEDWSIAAQLHPKALETLHQLSPDRQDAYEELGAGFLEAEMMQISADERQQRINTAVTPVDQDCPSEPISALTIPSPGGFFSSLRASARHSWCSPTKTQAPSTSTAEQFYGVPWRRSLSTISEVNTEDFERQSILSRRPSTVDRARISSRSCDVIRTTEIIYEYDQNYCNKLQEVGSANLDQTGLWLSAQASFLEKALREDDPPTPESKTYSSPDKHGHMHSPEERTPSSIKRAVRFADQPLPKPGTGIQCEAGMPRTTSDSTFYQGFQYIAKSARSRDAIIHGESRCEAIRLQRLYLAQDHQDQLRGKFEIKDIQRPCPHRPLSPLLPNPDESNAFKDLLDCAERERQALDRIQHSIWVLQAMKTLNHGQLLISPARGLLVRCEPRIVRVLDLGGEATCDWAWQLALSHRNIKVCTATTSSPPCASINRGPSNHRVVTVPHLWALPFPNASFDVISARTLYRFLRTQKPISPTVNFGDNEYLLDEYDLCLKECLRCLKPGGYLEFWVMDSDLIGPGRTGAALGVEFGFSLRTMGYDPQPTKSFVERLHKAGFTEIKRAWSILPLGYGDISNSELEQNAGVACNIGIADGGEIIGSTKLAARAAGLLGSWMWQKWVLKLQMEMGKEDARLLEGVPAALDEGRKVGSGWRCLSGWARKPVT